MTQVGGMHSLTVAHFCTKVKKLVKITIFADFDRKLCKINLEKIENVKNIKVALKPHRQNGIRHKLMACTV
jgi:hypothetical protein